ncbi:MAG: AMP-binding protein, partial [bacterium]|nr:AMP-binding protein [bacterium]
MLNFLLVGGEKFPPLLLETVRTLVKGKIYNMYGPTETTIWSTLKDLTGDVPLNIGKPIANTQIYILDNWNNLQPIGIPGELTIAGQGLARGYLNNPQLTMEKFISVPPAVKIYKTGDLARWLTDGNIEFLGRVDHQVKIRGFRIELGEIECRLLNHNEIKEAVVVPREDKKGNIHLCAYFVTGKEFTVTALRSYLAGGLPDYMLPSYFVPVEKIPLTPNGKVDRKGLPAPGTMSLNSDRAYSAPGNIIEKILAGIWQKVLGINTISINDNFFEIGGDSIKTIQIVSRMKKMGYKLEMRDIFQNPQISGLAPLVKKIERIAEQAVITGSIPLTPIQQWFFENRTIDMHHFNQAVMLYFERGIETKIVETIFLKLQEHHDALRMIYMKTDEGFVQVNQGVEHPFSIQVFDYRERDDATRLIEGKAHEIQASINLETGPLMKLGLFRMDNGDRLLIAIHHMVIDGVSWRILFEDIETLYRQYKTGKQLTLPLKTDSFKVWAEKLSIYADSDIFLKEKPYWAELDSKQAEAIENDFPEEGNYLKDVKTLSFTLNEKETELILSKVNEAFGTEIIDILVTAMGLAVKRSYGIEQLLIAMEGHGREEILTDVDVNRTVGWFTSLYPVHLDFSRESGDTGDRNLSRQIKEVKERLRHIPRKGIGYGILKYLTKDENKEGINFGIKPRMMLNYLGQFDEDLDKKSFGIARESTGKTYSIKQQREFEIEVAGMVAGKRLTMSISYSLKQFKRETIEKLSNHLKKELTHVITYCSSRGARTLTPSDFTYPGLSIEMLEQLQRKYSYLVEDIYTLTPMQEGMLFYALFENKKRAAYFEQMSYRLQGELNVPVMEQSLNELFKRHDVLRTAFIHEGLDRPLQVVLKERNVAFYFEDLRETLSAPEDRERWGGEFRDKDRRRSFDLSKDVLMRVTVQQLDDVEYQVTWSFHHILMDGWCIGILISEFFEIYTGCIEENRAFQLPPVKPYRTYIQWLEKQDKNKTGDYWKQYLEGYEEVAAVPKKMDAGVFEGGYKAGNTSIRFEEEKTAGLTKVAIGNHVTLNTVIQVAWGIVLGKYCSKQDVVYGVLISGRPPEIEGVESMVGCFINTVPVRITFDGKTKLNELLRSVQERAVDSEPHYYCSLAEIQTGSALKQNLLNHIIEFQNYPAAERIEGVGDKLGKNKTTETLELSDVSMREQGNYDFTIVIAPGSRMSLGFSYNANVYDSRLVEQLGLNCIRVLEQIIEDDKIIIDEIALLSEKERRKILFEFNNNRAGFPRDKTIYQFVEKHAELTPDRIALVSV